MAPMQVAFAFKGTKVPHYAEVAGDPELTGDFLEGGWTAVGIEVLGDEAQRLPLAASQIVHALTPRLVTLQ